MFTKSSWVFDLGATNHMINSSQKFITYKSYPKNRKITIIDSFVNLVAGQGNVIISETLTIKNVLHMAKLFTNFFTIQKVTKD